jgi:hypothetical protein
MRSFRRFLMVAGTVFAFTILAPSVSASTPHTLTLVKDCSKFTGAVPSYCTVTTSNVAAIPVGSRIWYYGPVISSSVFLSSTIVINDGHHNTATGYCNLDARSGVGLCIVWKGTGTLTGFHAIVNVSVDQAGLWHYDGRYYFTGR